MALATYAQNKSRKAEIKTCPKPVSTRTRYKRQNWGKNIFTMAIATVAQNKSRSRRHAKIYETCELLNTAQKTEPGKEDICTTAYGHRCTKQIQKTQNQNIYETCEHLNKTQKQNRGKQRVTMAMVTLAQNKSKKRKNPNIHKTCEQLRHKKQNQ
jgi:hypothetical protein